MVKRYKEWCFCAAHVALGQTRLDKLSVQYIGVVFQKALRCSNASKVALCKTEVVEVHNRYVLVMQLSLTI